MDIIEQFREDFRSLGAERSLGTEKGKLGPDPFNWQIRLFEKLLKNDIPNVCDLPTGMGKTSIIHLWVLALWRQFQENGPRLPTRLVYVVDRRTVVDQATEVAERIQRNLASLGLPEKWLSVSTLRGQFADNRDWTRDPSKPAIVIGTVDMIGSRLLFSGYRSSYKLKPLDAGLLGQDSLLVLDEAHLSEPFRKLILDLSSQGRFQTGQGLPMRVMCMSATSGDESPERFHLASTDLEGDRDTNPIVRRYEAQKRLSIEPSTEKGKIKDQLVRKALALAKQGNARVVVFVQKPDDAKDIAKSIAGKLGPLGGVETLTGTMRGLERDELLEKEVLLRFLKGEECPEDRAGKGPAILVSTSAGEVGFDLNADHMVCDAAPLDSMIQRLGRVNRRGHGDAQVHIFPAKPEGKKTKSEKTAAKKHTWESATAAATQCLERLVGNDASPKGITALKSTLTKEQLEEALSPKPETVELTDILLDAWSMTTIIGRMPGRPPVAAWLRGVIEEEPQTTIAWRAELDLDGFGELDLLDLEEWFDAHRVQPHETLSVPVSKARDIIVGRWDNLTGTLRDVLTRRHCIVERAGFEVLNIKSLVDDLKAKRTGSISGADIILPASLGGIQRKEGLLDSQAPSADDAENDPLKAPDVADVDPYHHDKQSRYRLLRTIRESDAVREPLVGGLPQDFTGLSEFTLDLNGGDKLSQLVSLIPKRARTEYGTGRQTLSRHVGLVEKHATAIAERLHLTGNNVRQALELAAQYHDEGKNRASWQRAVCRADGEEPIGKSGGSMGRVAKGYRHEFGSLREFEDEFAVRESEEVFGLAMHLIAAHHGRSRPHFPRGGLDPAAPQRSPQVATDAIRRFARLQRQYGYWRLAWLENLLRCADAMASADKEGLP